MRARLVAVAVATLAVTGLAPGPAPSAGATTTSFAATCTRTDPGAVPTHRTFSSVTHPPDSVAPGALLRFDTDVDYAPDTAPGGIAMYVMTEGPQGDFVESPRGSTSIHGPVQFGAPAAAGGVVHILLDRFGSSAYVGGGGGEVCTPDAPLVVARVAVGVPQMSIGDGAVVEGSTGSRLLELPVTLSRPATTDVNATFRVDSGTTIVGTDTTTFSGNVLIPTGHVSGIAKVRVRGDTIVEPTENFRVRLVGPSGAVLGRAVGTGRIIDDDPEVGTRLSVGDVAVVEGAHGTRSARFVVTLSHEAPQDVTVHLATVDGTAAAGSDYRAQSVDLRIPAGSTSVSVAVPVLADTAPEPTETFGAHLSAAVGATIGRANGVGKILDDD